jgi:anti-sigma regulatory factor (Ser/Thr protein kinase)
MTETTVRVKADAQAPRISRSHLNDIKEELGGRFDDVALVVSELVTNSVRHGSGDVTVSIRRQPEKIRVEVHDDGPGFGADSPRGEGLGLNIIERLVDDWGIRVDDGCSVWAELSTSA